jgi:hypothetical protein
VGSTGWGYLLYLGRCSTRWTFAEFIRWDGKIRACFKTGCNSIFPVLEGWLFLDTWCEKLSPVSLPQKLSAPDRKSTKRKSQSIEGLFQTSIVGFLHQMDSSNTLNNGPIFRQTHPMFAFVFGDLILK